MGGTVLGGFLLLNNSLSVIILYLLSDYILYLRVSASTLLLTTVNTNTDGLFDCKTYALKSFASAAVSTVGSTFFCYQIICLNN